MSRHVGHPWHLCKPKRLGCTAAMTADQLAFRIVLLLLGLGAWHASARPCSGNNTFHSLFKESDLPTSAPPAHCLERWHSSIAGPRTIHAGVTRRHEHSAASGMPKACRHGSYYGLRASEGNAKRLLQFLRLFSDQVNHAASGRHSTAGSKCLRANPACRWLRSGSCGHQGLASKGLAGHQKAAAGGQRHLPATLPQRRPDRRQRSRCCA